MVIQAEFRQQAQVMHDSGANGIIIAYAWERIEMSLAIEAAKSVANWPIFATPVFANSNWLDGREYRIHTGDKGRSSEHRHDGAGGG